MLRMIIIKLNKIKYLKIRLKLMSLFNLSIFLNKMNYSLFKTKNTNEWMQSAWYIFHITLYQYELLLSQQQTENIEMNSYSKLNKFILYFIRSIPCSRCKMHALQYLETHPLTNIIITHLFDYFHWSIHFHNSVNERLHKIQWNLKRAYNYYSTIKNIYPDGIFTIFIEYFIPEHIINIRDNDITLFASVDSYVSVIRLLNSLYYILLCFQKKTILFYSSTDIHTIPHIIKYNYIKNYQLCSHY